MDSFSVFVGLIVGLMVWPAVLAVLIFWGGHTLRQADREQERARRIARVH